MTAVEARALINTDAMERNKAMQLQYNAAELLKIYKTIKTSSENGYNYFVSDSISSENQNILIDNGYKIKRYDNSSSIRIEW